MFKRQKARRCEDPLWESTHTQKKLLQTRLPMNPLSLACHFFSQFHIPVCVCGGGPIFRNTDKAVEFFWEVDLWLRPQWCEMTKALSGSGSGRHSVWPPVTSVSTPQSHHLTSHLTVCVCMCVPACVCLTMMHLPCEESILRTWPTD